MLQSPHVVQPVCQFDDNDANIFSHCQEHSAEIFSQTLCFAGKIKLRKLGDTFDQLPDFRAEPLFYFFESNICIFNNVVEEAGGNHDVVAAHIPEYSSDSYRMANVRFSGFAVLSFVQVAGKFKGATN